MTSITTASRTTESAAAPSVDEARQPSTTAPETSSSAPVAAQEAVPNPLAAPSETLREMGQQVTPHQQANAEPLLPAAEPKRPGQGKPSNFGHSMVSTRVNENTASEAALCKAMKQSSAASKAEVLERFHRDVAGTAGSSDAPVRSEATEQPDRPRSGGNVELEITRKGPKLKATQDGFTVTADRNGATVRPAKPGSEPPKRDPEQRIAPAEPMKPGEGGRGMLRQIEDVNRNRDKLPLAHGAVVIEPIPGVKKEIVSAGTKGSGDVRDGWVKASYGKGVKVEGEANVKNIVASVVTGVATEAIARPVATSETAKTLSNRTRSIDEEVDKSMR